MIKAYTGILPMFGTLQLMFSIMIMILEHGKCSYDAYSGTFLSAVTADDYNTMQLRESTDIPLYLAMVEAIVGLVSAYIPGTATALGDAVPGLYVLSLVVVRLHAIGVFGCYDSDHMCCPALSCPNSTVAGSIPGCGDGDLVYWRNRDNYCSLPAWYETYMGSCNSLASTPDYVPCHTYGCNFSTTPLRYIAARVWAFNTVMLLLGTTGAVLRTEALRMGEIRVLVKKQN